MIIGYNFFGFEEGSIFDTPICTDHLDELRMGEGVYDEVYVDLDTSVPNTKEKPITWHIRTIMDAKFTGDLDAGDIGAEGFKVTHIQLYRAIDGTENWEPIAIFEYNPDYNVYNYVDRYVQNGVTYKYAIVPVANEVLGEKLYSDPVESSYVGIFLTDRKNNLKLEYDTSITGIGYNTVSSTNESLNSQYPIVVMGQTRYRTGNLTSLPLSESTIKMYGSDIDVMAEAVNKAKWVDLITNGKAKVLRMDTGNHMLVATTNVKEDSKGGDQLRSLSTLSFDFIEIGKLDYDSLVENNLMSTIEVAKSTFDDYGEVISA